MRHFIEELDDLQKELLAMAGLVEQAVHEGVLSVTGRDPETAQRVLINEARINQMEIRIDEMATRLLALNQPMARDLRFLTAAIKINNDLERMGDLAVNIVERALSLVRQEPVNPTIDMPSLLRKTKLEIAVNENFVETTIEAIIESTSTGQTGDGKIFVIDLDECVRIRTRERGGVAIG